MTFEQILYERRGRVGVVTLNRPEKMNAWTHRMMAEMREAVSMANDDPEVGAIVFTGAGRAFCAGADIGSFKADIDAGRTGESDGDVAASSWVEFVQANPKPLIAAINGPALGIGVTLILPFDIRLASEDARIGMFFVRMGLVPELASSYLLPQLVGTGRALDWCLTGRMILAQEAREAGLVSEVTPAGGVLARALEVGETVAAQSGVALGLIKRLLHDNAVRSDVRDVMTREGVALAEARGSWQHSEAVNAFLEKRPADFSRQP